MSDHESVKVKINGIEYPITRVSELGQTELDEAKRLFPRAASLLTWNVLEFEDAVELERILIRIVEIFLKSVPTKTHERLSNEQRIQLLTPISEQSISESEGGNSHGSR